MIPEVKHSSVAWMNFALCLSTGAVIPFVFFTKQKQPNQDSSPTLNQNENEKKVKIDSKESGCNLPYHLMH